MMRAVVLLVAMLALAFPMAAADDPDLTRPVAAFAVRVNDEMVVAWVPGPLVADAYRVYGLQNDAWTLLSSVASATHASVSQGYGAYQVTAVMGDAESPPTPAQSQRGPCVNIDQGPPPSIGVGCMGWVQIRPELELPPLAAR